MTEPATTIQERIIQCDCRRAPGMTAQVSPLKVVVLLALASPALMQLGVLALDPPMAQPITNTIHWLGDWAVYFLLASLAITPLRQLFAWPRLIVVRRMIGVASFAYALAHVTAFAADKRFNLELVLSEIVGRVYLVVGATGLVILAVLTATSTDGMVRRLGGKRWQGLHRFAYLAAAVALVHYFFQSKADLAQPTLVAGLFAWLFLYRLVLWTAGSAAASRTLSAIAITLVAAVGAALAESLYFAYKFGAPFDAVIAMQFTFDPPGPRPAAGVLAAGLALALAVFARRSVRSVWRARRDILDHFRSLRQRRLTVSALETPR